TEAEPWKRRLDESWAAYAAFRCFLELGVGRTARDAYRQVTGNPEASQTPGSWNEWIRRFEWSQRAIAWDNRVVTVHQEALESAVAKRAVDWVERDHQFREARYQTARRLLTSAETVSKFPVTAESVER